ncbi:MAG: cyclic nucleotide-binding domain-containing protein [Actinomycetes bacterium]
MQTMDEMLAGQPFFTGLDESVIRLIAGCATNVHVEAGAYIFREGEDADRFFVVRRGRVALELREPGGKVHLLDTVEEGEVLGWSWLVPPYRWFLDARAVDTVSAVSIDGTCLRGKCDEDPALGYALLQRVARVMYDRLQSTRVRLLDLYGSPHAGAR